MTTDKITLFTVFNSTSFSDHGIEFADHVNHKLVSESELDNAIDVALETENPYLVYTLKVNCPDIQSTMTCIGSGCTLEGSIEELFSAANLGKAKNIRNVRVIYDDTSVLELFDKVSSRYPYMQWVYDKDIVSPQEYLSKYPICIFLRVKHEMSVEFSSIEYLPDNCSIKYYERDIEGLQKSYTKFFHQYIV